jgi:hypothetical protein
MDKVLYVNVSFDELVRQVEAMAAELRAAEGMLFRLQQDHDARQVWPDIQVLGFAVGGIAEKLEARSSGRTRRLPREALGIGRHFCRGACGLVS